MPRISSTQQSHEGPQGGSGASPKKPVWSPNEYRSRRTGQFFSLLKEISELSILSVSVFQRCRGEIIHKIFETEEEEFTSEAIWSYSVLCWRFFFFISTSSISLAVIIPIHIIYFYLNELWSFESVKEFVHFICVLDFVSIVVYTLPF